MDIKELVKVDSRHLIENIKENLEEELSTKEKSLLGFAKENKIDHSYLYKVLSGSYDIRLSTIVRLSILSGISIQNLLNEPQKE